ncbi:diguanylate cyclase [Candidatus Kaiserbacteria bacterium CG10_big_fil_rev_8_21_14_0_10_51_14]|uniref:Diguanylate cyclase n=1 Tax=Candidatus Kaiserbacteria bacterium CG10_big_fil_rev_8_21_14_0_10_51_14 TaxID=1974610 RepID=A0A2H0UBX5_9BACT|nr:MAG: diguanylate cyclase [Candidatus Kaiserbacteria bacterium CG10_big_fil_rev_8_21_14_0_10_51_14]
MLRPPFYDPTKSYDENYALGPFNGFVDGVVFPPENPRFDFVGQRISYPLGIPAGPLLNSAFCKAAFEKGFDVCVYKTIRSDVFPCHPFPNVLAIHPRGDLTFEELKKPLVADAMYTEPLSITNSFGVPSRAVPVWQEDVRKAIATARTGQVLVLSFMGTVRPNQSQQEFIDDYVRAARLSAETGAHVLETNLSCPNIGNEGLVCYNLDVTEKVAKGIRSVIGNTPLILKVGYYQNDADMERLAEIANEYADSISGINTLQGEVRDAAGNQALPGPARLRSGVCGAGIKWAGLDFVRRLRAIKEKRGFTFSIEGVGGVITPKDFKEYRDAGADVVMSATGAMWNPYLAKEIKEAYPNA